VDRNALWVKVIKSIYGHCGLIGSRSLHKESNSPWIGILKVVQQLENNGIYLSFIILQKKRGVGDGVYLFLGGCVVGRFF